MSIRRRLSGILLAWLVVAACAIPTLAYADSTGEPQTSDQASPAQVALVMHDKDGLDTGSDHLTTGAWSDEWFAVDPTCYNHELATTASILASATYRGQHTDPADFAITYDLETLGFEHICTLGIDAQEEDNASVTLGVRQAQLEDAQVPLVVVAIGGSDRDSDWSSNFNLNNTTMQDTDVHEGFGKAADKVLQRIRSYLAEHELPASDLRILAVGHSRGAAITNLVGARLDCGAIAGIERDDVYVYTFATPNVSRRSDVHAALYDNIFNIVNPEDLVTRALFVEWGFRKYGVTYYLPSKSNCASYASKHDEMQAIYETISDGDIHSAYETGTWQPRAMVETIAELVPDTWSYYHLRHKRYVSNTADSDTMYELSIRVLVYRDTESAANDALRYPAYVNVANRILADQAACSSESSSDMTEIATAMKSKLIDAHRPANVVAWLQTLPETGLTRDGFYNLSITYADEVQVFDENGTLVASCVGRKVDKAVRERGLGIHLEGNAVCMDIPKDMNYHAQVTSSEGQPLDIAWKELDADGKTIVQTCYEGVDLADGEACAIDLGSKGATGTQETITVTLPGSGVREADFTTRAAEANDLSVEVSTEGNGSAVGVSAATRGEQVCVSAVPADGSVFEGWYEEGQLVSTDADYYFQIEASRSLVARFQDQIDIATAQVTGLATKTYTGKQIKQKPKVSVGGTKLTEGTDYTLAYKSNTHAGTAKVVISGMGRYIGTTTASFQIKKAKQSLSVKAKTKTLKLQSLSKEAKSVTGLVSVKKAQGTVRYTKLSTAKKLAKFKVNTKTGAITIPKGTTKGTYTLKIKVSAKETKDYLSATKTTSVTIRVQ